DGRVVEGTSHVNQAPITGESVPVTKEPGSEVFAGTVNGDGALVVEVTHDAGDTTLARIVRMVSEAQSRRGPSEQWVEKFAAYYTPAVLGLATLLALVPPLFGAPFDVWLYRGLVLLVIGCPCSLVISTPVTIVAAIAAAAGHGVLLKGGTYVEVPARLRAIALDKTGTLTEGRPRVVRVDPMSGHDERELCEIAHALEQRSDHPLATAIVEHAEQLGVRAKPAADFEIIQGKGASGTIEGERYWLGSHRYLEERGQETPEVHAQLEALVGEGRSVVVLGNDTHVCGFFALADAIRPQARASVAALRSAGVAHVVMLTGDNRGTAERVANETGVDEVRAELLPGDKVTAVEALVREYGHVAMVGDGVNDAPALARATLGIAMGRAGTDVALETADVALMSDDLSKIAWLIRHSRRAVMVIRQNIVFSLGVKALFVALALAGTSSLWMAIAADMGASLLVTFNGLRLLRDGQVPGAGRRD
ncbi:MAG: heavy metal translocating P-type ATPase, partial [Sandaracinaceae bacterium]|nr:heavy metal translocating P-type ATPase [Sandaracinaceae bacterium]